MLAAAATILVVAAIASVAARLLTHERGPFAVFADIRRVVNMTKIGEGWLGQEVKAAWGCPYCMSVWWCMGLHMFLFAGVTTWIVRVGISVCVAWLIIAAWRLGDPDDNPSGPIFNLMRTIQNRRKQ